MKFVVALVALFAVALAAPQNPDASATIVQQTSDIDPQGNFQNSVQTSNGIQEQAQGNLVDNPARASPEDPTAYITQQGSYSYTAPDGQQITVDWTADKEGFHPKGAHLPVAPVA
ncbi:larval cuticle protein 65Ag1-like [Contarinia nasturtii]|uniref:larval cuticle protein 65Ag1-like n=1 Tax=Contarinia nasturtii TaxID=265458 RepID=UPI0012D3E042|nr:larval cuticle protein 65Ag1-like [Contarinia nasturtii]XP_031640959.1 larval cuticle protein 65Ag1-like [Contarinia nasturtii]